jgi:hypothetical protein
MTVRRFGLVLVAALGVAGCAGDGTTAQNGARMFGLVSAPVPPAKPFVVESRRPPNETFPTVGASPAERRDRILTPSEQKALEAQLRAEAGAPAKRKPKAPAAPSS